MPLGLLSGMQFGLWLLISLGLAGISYRSFKNWKSHGFYRFFAFVGTAFVFVSNVVYWHDDIFSILQLFSWFVLIVSLGFLINSLYQLTLHGGSRSKEINTENFAFENTGTLVDSGIFAYIRHPMYSSLLLFTWGVWLKCPSMIALGASLVTTLAILITAKAEEKENVDFFGSAYIDYEKRTKRFIPYLF
ncbi:MAG: methyltransferase family protein [Cellvibrionaceae bacterium]